MLIAAECGLFFTSSHLVQMHVFMFVSETYLVLFLVLQEYFYTCNLVLCELRAWFVSREGKCELACFSSV